MTTSHDLRPLIDQIEAVVRRHELRPGGYSLLTLRQKVTATGDSPWPETHESDFDVNPYGCADAANLLYTIGRFPREPAERAAFVRELQAMQDPATGLFNDPMHHPYHCTAHCIAALELFDARPLHPLSAMHAQLPAGKIERFLVGLEWKTNPWNASHRGAGVYAALAITGEADDDWADRYFDWLWQQADAKTGLWRKGCMPGDDPAVTVPLFHSLAGTFHYLFNQESARRPLRYPAALVDTCLAMTHTETHLGRSMGFATIDWVYCLTRALRQSGHRHTDAMTALRTMADRTVEYLNAFDLDAEPQTDNLHKLFGIVCALAELQAALPGLLRTTQPLKLVLDRRPFI